MWQPAFSPARLSGYVPLMDECAGQLVARLQVCAVKVVEVVKVVGVVVRSVLLNIAPPWGSASRYPIKHPQHTEEIER